MSETKREVSTYNFAIETLKGNPIKAEIFYPSNPQQLLPLIPIVHGFTGFKDWGFLPFLARNLAQNNFAAITFNFSHDGIQEERDWVNHPELFEQNTISLEVEDLRQLINSIENGSSLPNSIQKFLDIDRISLIGQSLGGAVSLIYTGKYNNVDKIVMLGSIGTLYRYTNRQLQEWKRTGFLEFNNSRTGQTLRISYNYIQDIYQNDYKLENYLRSIKIPVLYIHGSEDVTVPLSEVQTLLRKSQNPYVILEIIKKTGHTFGIEHPLTEPSTALLEAIEKTVNFLKYE
ncbi:MAG: alpha/beta hydrolase family protein [Candidatus Kapaibacteriales bacterium]